jgi:hypothetical protein
VCRCRVSESIGSGIVVAATRAVMRARTAHCRHRHERKRAANSRGYGSLTSPAAIRVRRGPMNRRNRAPGLVTAPDEGAAAAEHNKTFTSAAQSTPRGAAGAPPRGRRLGTAPPGSHASTVPRPRPRQAYLCAARRATCRSAD